MKNIIETLADFKPSITDAITRIIQTKINSLTHNNAVLMDGYERIAVFAQKGKMVRGGLFLILMQLFSKKMDPQWYQIAAGIELFHSALLMHDDVMDNDDLRRGEKTIYAQYAENATKCNIKDSENFGRNMAFCLGDICIFLSFEVLSLQALPPRFFSYFFNEAQKVGMGQLLDFYLSKNNAEPTPEDILTVYCHKTARYTFTLPMVSAAILTNQSDKIITSFEYIGEQIGLIFQIRDDEMRMHHHTHTSDKTNGSDIRENTKTLMRHFLFHSVTQEERKKITGIFGNPHLQMTDIEYINSLIKKYAIHEHIKTRIERYRQRAIDAINNLPMSTADKTIFFTLLAYSYDRTT